MMPSTALALAALALGAAPVAFAADAPPKPKPEIRSIEPFWITNGKPASLTIHGQDLAPTAIKFADPRIEAKIVIVGAVKPSEDKKDPKAKPKEDNPAKGNVIVETEVAAPAGLKPDSYPFKVILGKGETPLDGKIYIDDPLPVVEPKEPNDSLKTPQILPPGSCAVVGNLAKDGVDVFRIDGKAGETWRIEVVSHRAGSTLEPVLRLRDPHMTSVRVAVDEGKDCALEYRIPENGPYLIELFDGDNRTDPAFFYRLSVRRVDPPNDKPLPSGASLSISPAK